MVRYLDTGGSDYADCMATWFTQNLVPDMRGLHAQFGYYEYAAIAPFATTIRVAGQRGAHIHFVFGANHGCLTHGDLRGTYKIIHGLEHASLTVVAFSNALFHPKVVAVQRGDGTFIVIVGSGNLTEAALGRNVEAFLEIDTAEDEDEATIQRILDAIAYWRAVPAPSGAYHITCAEDVDTLLEDAIVSKLRPSRVPVSPDTKKKRGSKRLRLASRKSAWRTQRRKKRSRQPRVGEISMVTTSSSKELRVVLSWHKKLSSSDAQVVRPGTNPTGKLRLSKAGHSIDHKTWFRQAFFAGVTWKKESRGTRTYDVAGVEFSVSVLGENLGKIELMVDHAEHRIAGQNNVPTYLAWGSALSRVLRRSSYVRQYVILERLEDGHFILRIDDKP